MINKKKYTKPHLLWLSIKSIFLYVHMLIWFIIFSLPATLTCMMGLSKHRFFRWLIKKFADLYTLHLRCLGIQFHVKYENNIDVNNLPLLIALNHTTGWDLIFFKYHFFYQDIRIISKTGYNHIPIFNFLIQAFQVIEINRKKPYEGFKIIDQKIQEAKQINNQISIVIAPQGTRRPHTDPMKFKKGCAILIKKNAIQEILLIGQNTATYLPTKKLLKYPGHPFYVLKKINIDCTKNVPEINQYLEKQTQILVDKADRLSAEKNVN